MSISTTASASESLQSCKMTNYSNNTCSPVNFNFTHIFLPTVYANVFVFGLLGNCWGLKSVYTNWIKLGEVNVFVLNLCVADILYLLTLPFLFSYYRKGQKWIFGQDFCKITRLLFSINLYGSIGFLTCISVYRYLAIVHPLKMKGRITVRDSVAIATLVWVLVFLQSLPDVFFEKTRSNLTECYDTTTDNMIARYLQYSIGRTVIGFGIPLVIIACSYGHVAFTLVPKKNAGNAMLKLRCLMLVVILALLFSVCYIPYHLFRNLNLQTRIWKLQGHCEMWYTNIYIANQISNGLACLNSALNPLVYLFSSDKVLLRCFRCRHFHQETLDTPGLSPVSSPGRRREGYSQNYL